MCWRVFGATFAVVAFLVMVVSPALAQDDEARARALFQEGLDLANHGDWPTAAVRFEAAVALRDTPPIRYNLAGCLDHLGRLVEALAQLDALETGGHATASIRQAAQRLRAELEPRVGRIVVQLRGDGGGAHVELDRHPLDASQLGQPVLVDPGTRRVTLIRGDETIDDVDVIVAEGGVSHVVLTAAGAPVHAALPTASSVIAATDAASREPAPLEEPPPPASEDVTSAWWFWTLVGMVVVGAGVGIGLAVGLSQPSGPSQPGDFSPGVVRIGG